jgi:hypothetical protein
MQKANSMAEIANFLPRFILTWKMMRCAAAPSTKKARNIEVIGPSMVLVGAPPSTAVAGGYGGC